MAAPWRAAREPTGASGYPDHLRMLSPCGRHPAAPIQMISAARSLALRDRALTRCSAAEATTALRVNGRSHAL